jgi:hypothetical protein
VIIYDLKCPDGHRFEGWFKDRGAFTEQQARRLISCPVCASTEATVVPSPVAIRARDNQAAQRKEPAGVPPLQALREFQEYIQKNFDDVGDKFAEVALRIHQGEEDGRNIRGSTTQSEEDALRDQGVQFFKLPVLEYDA